MVETSDDVQRLLNGSAVALCLDTGHLLIGGNDPADLARQAPDRVAHAHLRDVNVRLARQVTVDENEDGGRAVVIEEGISALVFTYASRHHMLDGVKHVDQRLLGSIELLAAGVEVGLRTQAEWEKAVLAGFAVFRALHAHGGGTVHFDADEDSLTFEPSAPPGQEPPIASST